MPQKLTTTIKKISMVPNSINSSVIQEFHRYMQSSGSSERNQNNNLKAIIAFANFVGHDTSFDDIRRSEQILRYLDTKIKNIKTYMIIAGCGIFLIFSANQVETQITGPYPPFGVATIIVLNIAAFLMLVGIYNSAVLVSANNDLRKSIYKYALGSKLLGQIGRAEVEIEMQKAVTTITNEKKHLMTDTEQPVELDGMELKKYLEFVIREVKKDKQ